MGPGFSEILIIFLVVIIFFGAKKIPELARGLGLGLREFKKAKDEITDEVKNVVDEVENTEKEVEK